mgnify:CR=1 FL=1|jgi:CRP-like cAMP-binding protein
MFGKVVYLANVKTVVYMETNKSIAKRIIESYSLSFNNEITSRLADIVYSRELGRGELFLDEGQVSKSMGYVEKGIVRQFYYKNGKDLTEHFSSENRLFICIESFLKQEPTRLMAEALEPALVWGIPHDAFFQLVSDSPEMALLYRKMLEHSLIESQVKADMFRFETAHDRYEKFLKLFPEPAKRAPLIHIASFLQMTPETLSRVRAGLL